MQIKFLYKKFLFLLFSILLITSVFAEFYADISINVNSAGDVSIIGNTNYAQFINVTNSPQFTSKKKDMWILNISSGQKDVFSNFIYTLTLPANAQVNYLKTTPDVKISNENSKIKITGVGQNKPFTILVEYELDNSPVSFFQNYMYWIAEIGLLIILSALAYIKFKPSKNKNLNIEKEIEDVIGNSNLINPAHKLEIKKYDSDSFPQRQKKIINLLKSKKAMTQDDLNLIMQIPKSSLSRNIKALEIKGIVSITSYGRYNKIVLNEKKLR